MNTCTGYSKTTLASTYALLANGGHSEFIKQISKSGNTYTFTKSDGTTIDLTTISNINTLIVTESTNVNTAYESNLKYYLLDSTSGTNKYAGSSNTYGFPTAGDFNGLLWLSGGIMEGTNIIQSGGQIGVSTDENLYYRYIISGSIPTITNGGSWKKIVTSSLDNVINLSHNSNNAGLRITGTTYDIAFLIGSGNIARGIFEYKSSINNWLLYFNANNTILNYGNILSGSSTQTIGKSDAKWKAVYADNFYGIASDADTVDNLHEYELKAFKQGIYELFTMEPYIASEINIASTNCSLVTPTKGPYAKVWKCTNRVEFHPDKYIAVSRGETLYLEAWIMRPSSATGDPGTFYVGIDRYDGNKKPIATNEGAYYVINAVTVPTDGAWYKYSGYVTLPTTHTSYDGSDGKAVKWIRPRLVVNSGPGTITTYLGGFRILKTSIPCTLTKESVGAIYAGRDNVAINKSYVSTSVFNPIIGAFTQSGHWAIGTYNNDLYAIYCSNTDYNNLDYSSTPRIKFPNKSGVNTLALTSDITDNKVALTSTVENYLSPIALCGNPGSTGGINYCDVSINPYENAVYAAAFYTLSDIRFKTNIEKISDSIYSFNLKETGLKQYGFIAQELEKEYPELISGEDYKRVNYNSALALTIAKLENRIKELEEKLNGKDNRQK